MMTPLIIFFVVYVIGYVVSLIVLIKWGKKMGFDYSGPHDGWYDDYGSNKEAYTAISFASWVFLVVMGIVFAYKGLMKITGKFIKD